MQEQIKAIFTESIQTQISAVDSLQETVDAAAQLLVNSLLNGHHILCCGEAGGELVARQFSALMMDGFSFERPPFPVLMLNRHNSHDNSGSAFAKQVAALGKPGDVLLAISSRADSNHIVRAMEAALSRQMVIIAITGENDNALAGLLGANDIEIRIPSKNPARIAENQLLIAHSLCQLTEHQIFPQEHDNS
ncbi:SIS domain-containing protein [Idiomarina xiamenensis]|uniref:Phosphoheptose isomerase n=1 Tax=Idiomarina xiamenensis 10-D-4 TaxID=740709 RepID=K2KF36_9GAMM|nr:SIS domain-containing protein [Idiomarina xiamenensis]EKE85352.1 phosphoheptose isomerase [Idiomarina xiamenensis 10-D-4]